MRILIVEDDENYRTLITEVLGQAGHTSMPELNVRLAREKLGVGAGRALNSSEMIRAAGHALKLCGGYRRMDKYFLPLVLSGSGNY